jgi:two-component system nitrogen regulation sensor histidine kinase NtrY
MKNAGEAIDEYIEKTAPDQKGEIHVSLSLGNGHVKMTIADNGAGLPADRSRLFEPYMTTRAKGTGLGLPIVKKIIEEHGGTLTLTDAAPFAKGVHAGALATITLPYAATSQTKEHDQP